MTNTNEAVWICNLYIYRRERGAVDKQVIFHKHDSKLLEELVVTALYIIIIIIIIIIIAITIIILTVVVVAAVVLVVYSYERLRI
jgi:hypothetical protein